MMNLTDVGATAFLTLAARALESQTAVPIIHDPEAVRLYEAIKPMLANKKGKLYRMIVEEKLPPMLAVTVSQRARRFDRYVRDFLQRQPNGVVVNLGCGLDTRFQRLDDGQLVLYDLDLPEMIAVKRTLVAENERYRLLAASVLDIDWMQELREGGKRPFLFLAEGLFMYLLPDDVKRLVLSLQMAFPGCELVAEVFNGRWLHGWRGRMTRNKMQRDLGIGHDASFRSGLTSSNEMEQWHPGITFLDDWSYFDDDEPKLGLLRLFRHIELFRKMQWVVHYKLS